MGGEREPGLIYACIRVGLGKVGPVSAGHLRSTEAVARSTEQPRMAGFGSDQLRFGSTTQLIGRVQDLGHSPHSH